MLSSPDILTSPGAQATFLVGGQVPIPFSTGLGQVSIIYKDFGVQLNVTPTLQANGTIAAQISPDISDLDFQDGVNENGFLVPALKESRLSTRVVTKPGQSIVMGGMLRHQESRVIEKVPVLGDIPVLGKLFSSTSYQDNQTDVVFVMTPENHQSVNLVRRLLSEEGGASMTEYAIILSLLSAGAMAMPSRIAISSSRRQRRTTKQHADVPNRSASMRLARSSCRGQPR